MRRLPAITLTLGLLAMAGTAQAMTTITNHEFLPEGTTLEQCLARGREAIGAAGLRVLESTRTAAWGQNASGSEIYTIYCVPDRAVAVVIGSTAGEGDPVDAMVTRLRELIRSGGARRGVK